jgi:hypothetical protein
MVRRTMRNTAGTRSQSSRMSAIWAGPVATALPPASMAISHIGLGEGRRVIDIVTDHDHDPTLPLIFLYNCNLILYNCNLVLR